MEKLYIDNMMTNNYPTLSSSEDINQFYKEETTNFDTYKINLKGGAKNESIQNVPTGGFPPIFIVDDVDDEKPFSSNRELTTRKGAISIKDILAKKKTN